MELGRWMKDLTTAGRQTWMRMEWKTIKLSDCKCPPDPPKLETNVWTEITSPNYPQVYCPNMNCQYFLTAPAGYQIIMNFTNFDTEAFEDRLAIFKGRNVTQKHQELYVEILQLEKSKSSDITVGFISTVCFDSTTTRSPYCLCLITRTRDRASGFWPLASRCMITDFLRPTLYSLGCF
ncbi:hypothetical protein WR25_14010 isoform B [Diploscapter pachys]|uniref:CUB domain-containing protein n=1 Tax=Diploscapter pachys TaxID=2018661 RepID=A0A2A2KVI9_9BILA|nr:hypothetical protein WR25_14010 isoform B [Diploscapter pachys]